MSIDDLKGQRRAQDPLELELHAVVSCLTWVLGTELGSSAKVVTHFLLLLLFVSLCGIGCPGTGSVDQAVLEFTEIPLPLPPECWD